MFKKLLLLLCVGLLSQALSAAPQVEIYEESGRGTKENPLPSGAKSTFTALINGAEAWRLSGYGFEWRSNPQFTYFGSDTHTVSFELPKWSPLVRFDVILTLGGMGGGQVHTQTFWAKRLSLSSGDDGSDGGSSDGNSPPSLSISADPLSAVLGETISLSASGTDPDGDILSYRWFVNTTASNFGTFVSSSKNTSYEAPTSITTLYFTAEVRDGVNSAVTKKLSVGVGQYGGGIVDPSDPSQNTPPVAKAVPGKTQVSPGDKVVLDGTQSTDAEGASLTYIWTLNPQNSPLDLTSETQDSSKVSFIAPEVEEDTIFKFTLKVNDGETTSAAALVEVLVISNHAPGSGERNRLVFPVTLGRADGLLKDTFIGVAIMNPGARNNPVTISGTTEDGFITSFEEKGLNGEGQLSFLTSESTSAKDASSLVVQGESGRIRGFFMAGDLNLARLDGIGGELQQAEKLFFPVARHGGNSTQVLYLFNPSVGEAASLELSLYQPDGKLVESISRPLAPSGTVDLTVDNIFGWQDQSVEIEDGFLVVKASVPVLGFQYLVTEKDLSSIAGQPTKNAEILLVPHILLAKDGGTEIRLLNSGSNSVHVSLEGFDDTGQPIGDAEFTLGARKLDEGGKLFVGDLAEMLGIDTSGFLPYESMSGYLRLTLSGGKVGVFERPATVLGTITFYGNDGNFSSTLPMLEAGSRKALFLHVAQSLEVNMFTGLAILNPGDEAAQIQVLAFDTSGQETASVEFEVNPGERRVDLLNGVRFFGPEYSQIGGHVKVISDQPVVSFSLFGSYDSMFLAAIEGQTSAE